MPAEEQAVAVAGDVGTGDPLRKQWLVTARGRGAVRQRARGTVPSTLSNVLRITRISAECATCTSSNQHNDSGKAMPLTQHHNDAETWHMAHGKTIQSQDTSRPFVRAGYQRMTCCRQVRAAKLCWRCDMGVQYCCDAHL